MEAIWLGQSEPTDWRREQEWNRWYSRTHQPEDLATAPGLTSYARMVNLTPDLNEQAPGCKYAVLYEFHTDSIITPLARIMEIDAETVRAGRHFEAHRGAGGGFLGARLDGGDGNAPDAQGPRADHGVEDLRRTLTETATGGSPSYTPERSEYLPPLEGRGWYISLISAPMQAADDVRSWLRGGYPVDLTDLPAVERVRCYSSLQREPAFVAAVFVDVIGDDLRAVNGEIIEREIEHARTRGRPAGVHQTGITFQGIDANRLDPLETLHYPTDLALYPYLVDDSIGRFMASIETDAAGAR